MYQNKSKADTDVKLAEKNIKTVIKTVFYMFKKWSKGVQDR